MRADIKRWWFSLIMAALVVVATEASSHLLFLALYRAPLSYGRIHREQFETAALPLERFGGSGVPFADRREVIHPYLGFVWESPKRSSLSHPRDLGRLGFNPLGGRFTTACEPGSVHVAVLGGSVAERFGIKLRGGMRRDLARALGLSVAKMDIQVLALGGHKQPQQLFSLAYLLALGAHFDLVIVLDGFNELTVPALENVPVGVDPRFPRAWRFRVGELDPDARAAAGRLTYLASLRRRFARAFLHRPLRPSATACLVWKRMDGRLGAAYAEATRALMNEPGRASFIATGPFQPYATDAELASDCAAFWASCSRQMDALCSAQGIRYAHFLQPNQYVPGSKPMTPEEKAAAIDPRRPWKRLVEIGYPELRLRGERLASDGVPFHDMTQVFADVEAITYGDTCCHLTTEGNRILAQAIGKAIAEDVGRHAGPPLGRPAGAPMPARIRPVPPLAAKRAASAAR